MTKEDIIRMAREAGAELAELPMMDAFVFSVDDKNWNSACLERFAALVAAAEREACAKVCDEVGEFPSLTPRHCADSIRARGETK